MITEEEMRLLLTVQAACEANPTLVAELIQAANSGVSMKLAKLNALNSDLACLAALAMARRTKDVNGAVLKKLHQLNGRSYIRWDDDIAKLEARREVQP